MFCDIRTPEYFDSLNRNYTPLGVHGADLPQPQHKPLLALIESVAKDVQVSMPLVVVHKGNVVGTAMNVLDNVLIVSERLDKVLSPLEAKALLAHELDHKQNTGKIARMNRLLQLARPDVETTAKQRMRDIYRKRGIEGDPYAESRVASYLQRFHDYLEFSADGLGVKLYGAEAMQGAITKILVEGGVDLLNMRQLLFYDKPLEEIAQYTPEQVAERVRDIVAGTVQLPGQIGERFKRISAQKIEGRV